MSTSTVVAYQGEPGSNSAAVSTAMFPAARTLPCATFADVVAAVTEGEAGTALIPVENSSAGRVADVHHLLASASSGLRMFAEYFLPIRFDLVAPPGATLDGIRTVRSHVHALGQCRKLTRAHGWRTLVSDDTAGAAREVAELGDPAQAAFAPPAAAGLYGLAVLAEAVEDEHHNTTRFLALAPDAARPPHTDPGPFITSLLFRTRNIPASLYKALGAFASNGVNITKIESYQLGGSFFASQFYVDIEGHPEDPSVALALEELSFFSAEVRELGVYPAHPYRTELAR